MAVEGEFAGVMQHQDQRTTGPDSLPGRLQMPTQNLFFADARIGEKSVGRLGVRPVLTRPRDAAPDVIGELSQKLSQSADVAFILKPATRQLLIDPSVRLRPCKSPAWLHDRSSPRFACLS